jgi:hypothetical protein
VFERQVVTQSIAATAARGVQAAAEDGTVWGQ